jgi:exopolyphosphatase/guanosine-5'-triphosphate,3'-diphosphate pyrophosphatase
LPLGTGTLIAKAGLTQPATPLQLEALEGLVAQALDEVEFLGGSRLLTCGGVARGQWRALHPDGDAEIHVEELDYLAWSCARLTSEQIAARFNVKLKRASSLLPGASVFRAVMRRGGFETMRVSKFGVREGAILEMFEGKITGCAP